MKDSDFQSSGIRKMISKITGIDIFKIDGYEPDPLNEKGHQPVIIHFNSDCYKDRTFRTVMSQAEFNKLCASDLASFKAHFEKIAFSA